MESNFKVRTTIRPGDLGYIVYLHGTIYSKECSFDQTFEAYVAEPLSRFVLSGSPRQRIWIAERDRIIGCIAIVEASTDIAQLRWFLVDPTARGFGLGKRLLTEAIAFSKKCSYQKIILWTAKGLEAASHLYRSAGFQKVEEKPGKAWGMDVVEERYELTLSDR